MPRAGFAFSLILSRFSIKMCVGWLRVMLFHFFFLLPFRYPYAIIRQAEESSFDYAKVFYFYNEFIQPLLIPSLIICDTHYHHARTHTNVLYLYLKPINHVATHQRNERMLLLIQNDKHTIKPHQINGLSSLLKLKICVICQWTQCIFIHIYT